MLQSICQMIAQKRMARLAGTAELVALMPGGKHISASP
jgi:hypothetical protein